MKKLIAYITGAGGLVAKEVPDQREPKVVTEKVTATPLVGELRPVGRSGPVCCAGIPPDRDVTGAKINVNEAEAEVREAIDEVKGARYPTRRVQPPNEPFVWQTDDGDFIKVRRMATEHIFFTVRMLFNHSVPPALRVGDFKRHEDTFNWPVPYKIQATNAMLTELAKRTDTDAQMRAELKDMSDNLLFFNAIFADESYQYAVKDVQNTDALTKLFNDDAARLRRDIDRRLDGAAQKDNRKAARMRKAVRTGLAGFPGKRCMEHRSYAGIRKPRVECNACKQVFNARRRNRKNYRRG